MTRAAGTEVEPPRAAASPLHSVDVEETDDGDGHLTASAYTGKMDSLDTFAATRSGATSPRTPPVSNGPSESGMDGSMRLATHARTTASSSATTQVSGSVMHAAPSPTWRGGGGEAGHQAATTAQVDDCGVDNTQDSYQGVRDSLPAEDDDAPPPLTMCTMKASSRGLYAHPTHGPSSPYASTPQRKGPSVAQRPVVATPVPTLSTSPSTTTCSPRNGGGGAQIGKATRRRSHGNGQDAVNTHRPVLNVYAPQCRRLKGNTSRRTSRKSDSATRSSAGEASLPASPPRAPESPGSAPAQARSGSHGRLHRSPRAPSVAKSTIKRGGKGAQATGHTESAGNTVTPSTKTPSAPSPGQVNMPTDGGPGQTVEGRACADGLAIRAVPLSISGRLTTATTMTATTSASFNGLSSHAEGHAMDGDSGSFSSPIVASHVARPMMSAVFCRELSTSLGATGGGDASVTASTVSGLPQLAPQAITTPRYTTTATSSAHSSAVKARRRLDQASTSSPLCPPTGAGGEAQSPSWSSPSWSSPTRTWLSPCRPPSALPLDPTVPTCDTRAAIPDTTSTSADTNQHHDDSFDEADTDEEGEDAGDRTSAKIRSLCSQLPSVLVDKSTSGGSALSRGTSVSVSQASGEACTTGSSPRRSLRTQSSSHVTSTGQLTPQPASTTGPPSEFVLHIQQRAQQQQQQQPRHSTSNNALSPSSPTRVSPGPALPPLRRSSRSQSLQLSCGPQSSIAAGVPTARATPLGQHNYSLSPHSPGPYLVSTSAVPPLSPATSHRAAAAPACQSNLLEDGGVASPLSLLTSPSTPAPALPGAVVTAIASANRVSPHSSGCFSMAAGFDGGSYRGSRTGSGMGPAPSPAVPLTLARVAALANGSANTSSTLNNASGQGSTSVLPNPRLSPQPVGHSASSTAGHVERSQRPPLATSAVPTRAAPSPAPVMPSLTAALAGPFRRASHQTSEAGSVVSGGGGSSVWTGAGYAGAPDAYRSLFVAAEFSATPSRDGSPVSSHANGAVGSGGMGGATLTDGQAISPPTPTALLRDGEGQRTPHQGMRGQTLRYVEPQLPPKPLSRPAGARHRHAQHTGLTDSTPR